MEFSEYQELASRTDNHHELAILNYALGLAGEAGEVTELIKKDWFHGRTIDRDLLAAELGDVLWYVAALARRHGLDLDAIARGNIEKLMARYPEGFKPRP